MRVICQSVMFAVFTVSMSFAFQACKNRDIETAALASSQNNANTRTKVMLSCGLFGTKDGKNFSVGNINPKIDLDLMANQIFQISGVEFSAKITFAPGARYMLAILDKSGNQLARSVTTSANLESLAFASVETLTAGNVSLSLNCAELAGSSPNTSTTPSPSGQ